MPHRRHVAKLICGTPFLAHAAKAAATDAVPADALMQPAELAALLKGDAPPLALQVGFKTLYDQAHIPGSPYAGPGNTEAGLANLKAQVAALPKDRALVIYCGCCPWVRCPNIAASFEQLHSLGFHNVKAVRIDNNFGADWVDKGYPVTRGE
jgi:rhodanese-related sulfurtransferase